MFRNRLEKVYRHLSKSAKRQGIGCYRIYDHDLPEFPFLIELYEGRLYVSEYKRRHGLSDEAHDVWLEGCRQTMADVLSIDPALIYIRMRQRKAGRLGQYQRFNEEKAEFVVQEAGLSFIVNLSDYLDTGLFLDHRITRQQVRELSAGKRLLNLFCYTGSFSVYGAAGGASNVRSVDLSKTYLAWAEKNMQLNFPSFNGHEIVHADAREYLKGLPEGSFDLIVMDPPTFSNSKRMEGFLDIQRDHAELVNDCLRALTPGGILFFSTNYTRFELHAGKINSTSIRDITRQTTPFDFEGKLKRYCFRIEKAGS